MRKILNHPAAKCFGVVYRKLGYRIKSAPGFRTKNTVHGVESADQRIAPGRILGIDLFEVAGRSRQGGLRCNLFVGGRGQACLSKL